MAPQIPRPVAANINLCDTLWNDNAGQAGAAGEGSPVNHSDTLRDGDALKACAALEGHVSNFCDPLRDDHIAARPLIFGQNSSLCNDKIVAVMANSKFDSKSFNAEAFKYMVDRVPKRTPEQPGIASKVFRG